MALFIGSFIVFVLAAVAMAIGILFRGRPMHAGCRSMPGESNCESETLCNGACKRSS
ncbi:MAG: hypothetical protein WDZ52_02640 [Pseudohongiellaceae bacterium]